jgi:MacB-like protein/KAP-like P-loop domain-containing protein
MPSDQAQSFENGRTPFSAFTFSNYSALAAWTVEPPLSIGLFGKWGSGKSFFMQKCMSESGTLLPKLGAPKSASAALVTARILFKSNSMPGTTPRGNLWASLVEYIFQNLRVFENDDAAEIEERQRKLFAFPLFVVVVEEPERVVRMQNDILDRIAAVPGVASVAMTNSVPMDGIGGANPIFFEGQTYKEGEMPPIRKFKFIGPDYFRTLGNRVIAGRDFSWTDLYEKRPVAIINEKIAREQWRESSDAIGKRVRDPVAIHDHQSPWREIVGVVEDVRDDGSDHEAPALVYWPSMMSDFWEDSTFVNRNTTIVIRTSRAGTESLINEIRSAIWAVNRTCRSPQFERCPTSTVRPWRGHPSRWSCSQSPERWHCCSDSLESTA